MGIDPNDYFPAVWRANAVNQGSRALQVFMTVTKDHNRAMVQLLTQAANWSEVTGLYVDVYNPLEQSVDLIVAIQTAN